MYKGKIIAWLFVFVCGLGACSNEELIPTTSEGVEVTFNVALKVNDSMTKATVAPAANEKTINNCLVAAFEKTGSGIGKCYGFYFGSYAADKGISLRAKSGVVRLVAIANLKDNVTIPDALSSAITSGNATKITYDQLKALTSTLTTFAPADLIKTFDEDITLAVGKVVDGTYEPESKEIALNQLPARIDVNITVEKEGTTFSTTGYSVDGINLKSNLFLTTTLTAANPFVSGALGKVKSTENTFSFYSYEKATAGAPVIITVSGNLKKGDKATPKTYRLVFDPKADGKLSVTNGIVHNYVYSVTGKITPMDGLDITVRAVPWTVQKVDVDYGKGETWD